MKKEWSGGKKERGRGKEREMKRTGRGPPPFKDPRYSGVSYMHHIQVESVTFFFIKVSMFYSHALWAVARDRDYLATKTKTSGTEKHTCLLTESECSVGLSNCKCPEISRK